MILPIDPAMVTTSDELSGYKIVSSLGVAEGLGVSVWTGMLPAGQKSVLVDITREALLDMLTSAAAHGANAIVGLRYAFPSSDRERIVLAYGTAVKVVKSASVNG